jgi:hypothetical protein
VAATYRVIYVADRPEQAELVRQALERRQIAALVVTERLDDLLLETGAALSSEETASQMAGNSPKIVVRSDDALSAEQVVLETVEASRGARRPRRRLAENTAAARRETPWPCCPRCRRPRLATCPICQTAGTDFRAAFLPDTGEDSDEHDSAAVLCPTCDEPFVPRHPARCEGRAAATGLAAVFGWLYYVLR